MSMQAPTPLNKAFGEGTAVLIQFIYLKKHLFSWLGLMNFSWFTLSWENHLAVMVCAGC